MLGHDWAVELVQQQGGKVDYSGYTALIWLFNKNPEKADFNSNGFKLLWEREKDIRVDKLKKNLSKVPHLKNMIVAAAPGADQYFDQETDSSSTFDE